MTPNQEAPRLNSERHPFSNEAEEVMSHAADEARRLNHRVLWSSHIFLGLMHDPDAMSALSSIGEEFTIDDVRTGLERSVGKGKTPIVGPQVFAPTTIRIMDIARNQAIISGTTDIHPEHLLVGIAMEAVHEIDLTLHRIPVPVARNLTPETLFEAAARLAAKKRAKETPEVPQPTSSPAQHHSMPDSAESTFE